MPRFGDIARHRDDIKARGLIGRLYLRVFGFPHIYLFHTFFHLKRMLKKARVADGQAILDAGCGKGYFSLWLAKKFPNAQVEAWDLGEENIRFCDKVVEFENVSNLTPVCDDLKNLDADETFDFIFCLGVLEHIPDNDVVIRNFHRALKPGGHLYISIPQSRAMKKLFKSEKYEILDGWLDEEHIGEHYTKDQLTALLNRIGFETITARTNGNFLVGYSWQANEIQFRNSRFAAVAVAYPFLKAVAYFGCILNLIRDNGLGDTLVLAQKTS